MFARQVLINGSDPIFTSVRDKIFSGALKLAYGGRLRTEYLKSDAIRRILRVLDGSGKARAYPDNVITDEIAKIKRTKVCISNDFHIIALAKVSGARLLCSGDKPLHCDFKNKTLLDNPRGLVYQTSAHRDILNSYCRLCKTRSS
jgi:hypothetical protein